MRITLAALALTLAPAPATLAPMNHGDHGAMSEGVHVQGVYVRGVVNSLGDGTANVTHEPMPEIGWPAMTMDLPRLDGAEVAGVGEGDDVTIMLEQGPDGMYGIRALAPAP